MEKDGKIFYGRLIPAFGEVAGRKKMWQLYDLQTKGRIGDKPIYFEDIGYKKLENVNVTNRKEIDFNDWQKESLKERGYSSLVSRRLSAEDLATLKLLRDLGYTTNSAEVNAMEENTITIPNSTGYRRYNC